MSDPDTTRPGPAEDHERKADFEKRYDLVDDSTPEPVNLAPTSDDTPVVNPFSPPNPVNPSSPPNEE